MPSGADRPPDRPVKAPGQGVPEQGSLEEDRGHRSALSGESDAGRLDRLQVENAELRRTIEEAQDTIRAIREGTVDAFVVHETDGHRVYVLEGAERPYRVLVEQMQQ